MKRRSVRSVRARSEEAEQRTQLWIPTDVPRYKTELQMAERNQETLGTLRDGFKMGNCAYC